MTEALPVTSLRCTTPRVNATNWLGHPLGAALRAGCPRTSGLRDGLHWDKVAAMEAARTIRRLAAILMADVVGYSRLMAADEDAALAALNRHRAVEFDPVVAGHNGRIVKLMGDGALVEFASVVDPVGCAQTIQTAAAQGTPSCPCGSKSTWATSSCKAKTSMATA